MNSNGGFGGVVLAVGDPADEAQRILGMVTDATAPAESRVLPDPIFDALVELVPKDPARRAVRDALVSERFAANQAAREFIEAEMREALAELKREHSQIRERGRAQSQVLNALTQELADARMEQNRTENIYKRALTDLQNAKAEKQNLGRFATDAELKKADARIAMYSGRVEKAEKDKAQAGEALNALVIQRIPPEKTRMEEIVLELKRVENLLAIFPSV